MQGIVDSAVSVDKSDDLPTETWITTKKYSSACSYPHYQQYDDGDINLVIFQKPCSIGGGSF